jgi:hypothetical protein
VNEEPLAEEELWPRGFDGHERAQLRRWARMSLADKLAWLEEAEELALNLQRARQRRDAESTEPSGPSNQ